MVKHRLWWGILITAVLGLALAVRIALFWVSCANMPAFDDECIIALQAKQIARGEFSLLLLAQPYMFPLEAYLMAPFIEFLPRTASGARVMAFGMGLFSLLLGWAVLRRWGRLSDIWPGVLILLFGSPFLLIMQYGMALPGYPSLIFFSMLMVWIAQARSEPHITPKGAAVLVGFIGGLVCSVTMLALPVLVMTGAMIGLHRTWRAARWTLPLFVSGAMVGMIPHWLVRYLYGGSGDVFRLEPWRVAFGTLMQPTLNSTLPAALGLGSPVVPGSLDRIDFFPSLGLAYGLLWLIFLGAVTMKAIGVGWRRWRLERWPSLDAGLFFSGVSWICLVMFIFSARSESHTYRYLTLIILAWPFLVGYYYCHSGRLGRWIVAGLTILVLMINVYNSWGILERWSKPSFGAKLKLYDFGPVIRYLDERGIRYAYSVYSDAYRLTFAADERIICAQLYNERFPAWPLPYKETVDNSTNVAYMLSKNNRFTAALFERDMASAKVTCRIQDCGAYKVYTDFHSSLNAVTSALFSKAEASHSSENVTDRLTDPDLFWRSEGFHQMPGMWVSVEWTEPQQVRHILLNQGAFVQDRPDTVHVYYRSAGAWIRLPDPLVCFSIPFMFENGHPVYGGAVTRMDLPAPVETSGLKLEIVNPRLRRAWTIYEIDIAP